MKDDRRSVPIDRIQVGARHRSDLGNLDDLMASIRDRGLLHPIVVTPALKLVAGQRRLEACRLLGWKEVPATVTDRLVDARALLMAERDENTCRKDMAPSEKVAIGRALEELEIPKAKERQLAGVTPDGAGGRGRKKPSGNLPEGSTRTPDVRDLIGEAVGMSGHTYHRAKTVVEAAEGIGRNGEPIPEQAQEVAKEALREMDATGKVTGAYNKVAPLVGRKPMVAGPVVAAVQPPEKNGAYHESRRRAAQKRRFVAAMSGIDGFCRGLRDLDLSRACAEMSEEERLDWAKVARSVATQLRAVAKAIQPKEA